MKLIDDWKTVAVKAWSMRLALLSATFSGAEVALPYFNGIVPPGTFAVLALVISVGAALSRLVHQPKMYQ
ncbi:hypothetical protein [Polynucleobacter sp. UK-Kesae-W10]|uniref:DUF7940 domain-containing protein n=1 Tax=Polynucleobacter sp. UK-Kesae-W10 TaxID=1819738 RepID=UPI001C0B8593|nr:hypothetical protein [Polynucleobacter sp. UK-Kesae-W10]MBU3577562.1 hypothetical protein [Polynucleobacter sp. UK-Kesae-W10]